MTITEPRDYEAIKAELDKEKTVGIVSCNSCVRLCQTGGAEIMKDLAQKLTQDGFRVVDTDLVGTPCIFQEMAATRLRGDITIVLACESGFYNLQKAFPEKELVAGLKTIGLGAVGKDGRPVLVEKL